MSKASNDQMNRREFLKAAGSLAAAGALAAAASGFLPAGAPAAAADSANAAAGAANTAGRPNILFINTDQQQLQALSGHGNSYVRTPNMDRLLKRGTTFMLSHSAHPVCSPARAVWFTGRPTSELGLFDNNCALRYEVPNLRLWLQNHGYSEMFIGKYGITQKGMATGYPVAGAWMGEFSDDGISQTARAFLMNYTDDKPFFISLGIHNPHDCCFWVMDYPVSIKDLPYPELADELPPLPANFNFDPREPETFKKQHQGLMRLGWNKMTWRYYEWSYYRMVEMADAEIGRVLDALEQSPHRDNTVIIFTADHGDGLGRHQTYSKWFLYDEALMVPLVVSWPGHFPEDAVDDAHLVSGLDIAPTICDLAGVPPLPRQRGASLRPLLEGRQVEWRDHVVSECGEKGRMVRTRDFKFITYLGDPTEQLFDMRADPGETRNLAGEAAHAETLTRMKKYLEAYEASLEKVPAIKV
ncbi:MAG: sulfatase-like hydrolase/transferase [Actinobacteria bacterium]|nr:sulfatase-like hydrolase/transferase [Actinomycetota bacterium]